VSTRFDERIAGRFLDGGGAVVNLRHPDIGAAGDGSTDDSDAFRRGFAALPDGGVLYVPPGEYRVTAASGPDLVTLQRRRGITVQGVPGASRVVARHSFADGSLRLFRHLACEQVRYHGLDIDVDLSGTPAAGGRLRGELLAFLHDEDGAPSRDVEVADCRLRLHHPGGANAGGSDRDAKLIGVYAGGSETQPGSRLQGFRFLRNTMVETAARVVWLWDAEDVQISGNRFLDCGGYPIIRGHVFGGRNVRIESNLFRTLERSQPAVRLDGKQRYGPARDLIVSHNHFECGARAGGIYAVDVEDLTITANTIGPIGDAEPETGSAVYAAIRVEETVIPSGHVTITGNRIRNRPMGVATEMAGPLIATANEIRDCRGYGLWIVSPGALLTGNRVSGCGDHGVILGTGERRIATGALVTGNTIEGNGGAGVMRVGEPEDVLVADNRIVGNRGTGVRAGPGWVVRGNRLSGNRGGAVDPHPRARIDQD
jgi:hypothetical protein